MVGLSATLPNYLDVANFLGVKREGVFYFDARHRPVPLQQVFIGIKEPYSAPGKKVRRTKKDIYNDLTYSMVTGFLNSNKQIMIFVHSRKETLNSAKNLLEKAEERAEMDKFRITKGAQREAEKVKNKELLKLIPYGIGIHNAGILRKDRNVVERLFLNGTIKVLVTTATLAWGVNLPAFAVIIKGTDVYDPTKGNQNISIIDVQQIFGRAGRPQFDSQGCAVLMTDIDKVSLYMGMMNNASYIESKFVGHMKEAMNAEVSLGKPID